MLISLEKPSEDVTGSTVAENQPENVGERAQNDGALTPSKKRKMKSPPGVNDDVEMEDVSQDGEEMEVEEQGQDDKEAAAEGVVKEGDERETDVVKTQEGVDPSVVEGKDESVVEESGEEKKTEKGDEGDKQIASETGQEDVGAGGHIDSDGGSEKSETQETAQCQNNISYEYSKFLIYAPRNSKLEDKIYRWDLPLTSDILAGHIYSQYIFCEEIFCEETRTSQLVFLPGFLLKLKTNIWEIMQ